jgi:hypothetical protein
LLTSATVPSVDELQPSTSRSAHQAALSSELRSVLLRHLVGVEPRRPPSPRRPPRPARRGGSSSSRTTRSTSWSPVGLLESLGYDATTADDGQYALEILAHETFDAC